jgi:DNA-binding NtrC family response regulator
MDDALLITVRNAYLPQAVRFPDATTIGSLPERTRFFIQEVPMKKRVLVIDDDESMRHLLVDTLEVFGYQVSTAKDGRQALDMLDEASFDLAICDLMMPRLNGRDFLKKVKDHTPGLPVIIITGYGTAQTEDEIMRLGARGYLSKPFTIEQIRTLVEQILGD